jgi:RimJ/RimL family protein N-acetyltransferase
VAITLPTNEAASKLLLKLGFTFERMITAKTEDLMLYSIGLPGNEVAS